MEIAVIFIIMYAVIAIMALVTIAVLCTLVYVKTKKPDAPKALSTTLIAVLPVALLLTVLLLIWALSHRSHPAINDWHFLGENINDIGSQYGVFDTIKYRDDGSGYAILMTEDITGRLLYDSGSYSCYRMEFDSDGTIVKVNCERPLGG